MKNKKLTKERYGDLNVKEDFYEDGSLKQLVISMQKNDLPFKFIISFNEEGNIRQAFEKPNLKEIDSKEHTSGAHVCKDPRKNHIDHYKDGKEWKEYPKGNQPFDFGFGISGNVVMI